MFYQKIRIVDKFSSTIFCFVTGYCSCPPFECICGYQQTYSTSIHQYTTSPTSYQHLQFPEIYWSQDTLHHQSFTESNLNPSQQHDFTNIPTDIFQPDEIFQIDHSPTIKTDFVQNEQNANSARSPSTLLDLGSGTIHREFKTEDYWSQSLSNMLINDDSNNSNTSTCKFTLSQGAENNYLLLNNSISQISQPPFLESKIDNPFPLTKPQLYQSSTEETNFKTSNVDCSESKISYHLETKSFQDFQTYQTPKMYSKQDVQDEYIDLSHYNDYSFLNVYENKISSLENTSFNELDFRINSSIASSMNIPQNNYSNSFHVVSHQ